MTQLSLDSFLNEQVKREKKRTKTREVLLPNCIAYLQDTVTHERHGEILSILSSFYSKVYPDYAEAILLRWDDLNGGRIDPDLIIDTLGEGPRLPFHCDLIRPLIPPGLCRGCKYRCLERAKPLFEFRPRAVKMNKVEVPSHIERWVPSSYLREGQLEAILQLLDEESNLITLSGPTGSGKTIVFLAKLYQKEGEESSIIVEPLNTLQDQIERSYGILSVKGRNNYRCPEFKCTCDLAPCNYIDIDCEGCEYSSRMNRAIKRLKSKRRPVVVNHGNLNAFIEDSDIIVMDEFHKIIGDLSQEEKLETIDKRRELSPGLLQEEYRNLVEQRNSLIDRMTTIVKEIKSGHRKPDREYIVVSKLLEHIDRKLERLQILISNLSKVLIYRRKDGIYVKLDEEYVIGHLISSLLKKGKTLILVSATPLNIGGKTIEVSANYITKENAPIFYFPVEKMTLQSTKNAEWKFHLASNIMKIIFYNFRARNLTKKAILHCGNLHTHAQKFNEYLFPLKTLLHEKGRLEDSINRFKREDYDFLIIASGEVGLDFYGRRFGLQFIGKVPYPSWDQEWDARARKFGRNYANEKYAKVTIDSIVQACGRICRGGDDVGVTVILDSKFQDLYNTRRSLFSKDFRSRLVDLSGLLR